MNIMNEIHEGNTEAMWELEELEWEYYVYLRNLLDLPIYPIRLNAFRKNTIKEPLYPALSCEPRRISR